MRVSSNCNPPFLSQWTNHLCMLICPLRSGPALVHYLISSCVRYVRLITTGKVLDHGHH